MRASVNSKSKSFSVLITSFLLLPTTQAFMQALTEVRGGVPEGRKGVSVDQHAQVSDWPHRNPFALLENTPAPQRELA